MSVTRKMMVNGKQSPTFYYEFQVDGKRFRGSTGCTTEREARLFERQLIAKLRHERSAKSLVENWREHLTGGRRVVFAEVFAEFRGKPRRHQTCERSMRIKQTHWDDFHAFMADRYPKLGHLAEVSQDVAEAYLSHLRTQGKFDKQVGYRASGHRKQVTYSRQGLLLSPRSVNAYHTTLIEIFDKLAGDAGLTENPFRSIPKWQAQTESREPFTPEELKLIGQKADAFIYPLFAIGMSTGLREGDICTLRWSEVNLADGVIRRRMLKTGKEVRPPILPPLRTYLETLKAKSDGNEFVLPDHARMYQENPTGIGYRVRRFLESLEITTSKAVPGRSRRVSTKDVHSLRHTFCYLAAIYGVPFNVVRSIVGHVDQRITQMYMDHADDEMRRQKLAQLPDFLGLPSPASEPPATPANGPAETTIPLDLSARLRQMDNHNWRAVRDQLLITMGICNGQDKGPTEPA